MADFESIKHQKIKLIKDYKKFKTKKLILLVVLIPSAIFIILYAVALGSAQIPLSEVFNVIINKLLGWNIVADNHVELIIWKLRLPRILMGLFAGIALGSSGAVMQAILKNPLADPYILGISSAAGFGASLAILFGVGFFSGTYLIIGNAFFFFFLSALLILLLAGKKEASPQTMVLIGLALLFFFQAMTTILQYFGNSDAVKAAVFWTIGDLGKADWTKLLIVAPLVTIGTFLLIWKSKDLNLLNAGDNSAKSMGINVSFLRYFSMIICVLMVSGIVSFTGTIGFIGLVAPHLIRLMIGADQKILIPASGLLGAVLLIVSDTIARTILSPVILPVGAVTAFLGVPLFVYLILRKRGTIL
ncbi:MAG: iron ABC transporter permease [Spirochaetes bacterium]|nr:iron ABC transporter permease [Spirochaetota bacterium]